MKRIDFIKRSVFTGLSFSVLNKTMAGDGSCTPTPEETEGPFPTHKPAALTGQNIIADRKGIPLTINIGVYNIDEQCAGLKDAIVDIWHCDNKGEYSEYGGKDDHGFMGAHGGRDMKMPPPPPPHLTDSLKRDNARMPPPPIPGGSMQAADHVKEHFLRGRQKTNKNGEVVFPFYLSRLVCKQGSAYSCTHL